MYQWLETSYLDVHIPLFKKSRAFNFFYRKASRLWNSLQLEIYSPSHDNFMNRKKSFYNLAQRSTSPFWKLILIWYLYVVCSALRTVQWTSIKNLIASAFAVSSKLSSTLHFIGNFVMPHERNFRTRSVIFQLITN